MIHTITNTQNLTLTETQIQTTTVTITKPPTTVITTPTTTITPPTITWGELAIWGTKPFSNECASCHGGEGDLGPPIIGTDLKYFENAQRLFDYMDKHMTSGGFGALSVANYLRILAFMLTESGFVQPEDIFDEYDLANIILGA
ncbi:c-type cytochrome [Chloroflexota bacterium]